MDILEHFKLKLEDEGKADVTVKNGVSSVRAFFNWYRHTFKIEEEVTTAELVPLVAVRDIKVWRDSFLNGDTKGGFVKSKKTPTTLNKDLMRLSQFYRFAMEIGVANEDPTEPHELLAEPMHEIKSLDEEQQAKVIRAARKLYLGSHLSKKKWRNYLVIVFLLNTGLRVDEMCRLRESMDVIKEKQGKEKKWYLDFIGKDNKRRVVGINKELQRELDLYFENHQRKGDYLFDTERSEKMSVKAAQTIIEEVRNASGVYFTAHMLRHTFAKNIVTKSGNLELSARVLGHTKKDGTANVAQTMRYAMSTAKEAADLTDILSSI